MAASVRSTAVTRAPARANRSVSVPTPHPISSTSRPRHLEESASCCRTVVAGKYLSRSRRNIGPEDDFDLPCAIHSIVRREERRRATEDLGRDRRTRGHDGRTARKSLERRKAKALYKRWEH